MVSFEKKLSFNPIEMGLFGAAQKQVGRGGAKRSPLSKITYIHLPVHLYTFTYNIHLPILHIHYSYALSKEDPKNI